MLDSFQNLIAVHMQFQVKTMYALSATLAIAAAKPGSTYARMRMYISASVLRHRRSLFSSQRQSKSCLQAWHKYPESAKTRDKHASRGEQMVRAAAPTSLTLAHLRSGVPCDL